MKHLALIGGPVGAIALIGAVWVSMTSAEDVPAGRQCQWTYLVDYDEPEIVGFPAHEPLAATQTGRNAMAKSNDPELKRRWEHLAKTGWQLKTATVNPVVTLGQVETTYIFEHCR